MFWIYRYFMEIWLVWWSTCLLSTLLLLLSSSFPTIWFNLVFHYCNLSTQYKQSQHYEEVLILLIQCPLMSFVCPMMWQFSTCLSVWVYVCAHTRNVCALGSNIKPNHSSYDIQSDHKTRQLHAEENACSISVAHFEADGFTFYLSRVSRSVPVKHIARNLY